MQNDVQPASAAEPGKPAPAKKLVTYRMLALFLGSFGAQSFYAGYVVKGVAQLLLGCTGISAIWALVDIFTVTRDRHGRPMKDSAVKNLATYRILAFFCSGFGAHNFYAGYLVRGLVQILLAWTGISWLWALVEMFVVKKDASGKPMAPYNGRWRKILVRTLKCLNILFALLLLLLIMAVIFRDQIAKVVIRKYGSHLLGVDVRVESFETSLFKGTLRMRKFSVGNPEGYGEKNAVELEELFVKVSVKSVFTKRIVVERVSVTGLNISCEIGARGINLNDIYEHLKKMTASKEKKKKKKKKEGPGTQVVISLLEIKNSSVSVSAFRLPPMGIKLDREMRNLGEKQGDPWQEIKAEAMTVWKKIMNFIEANNVGGMVQSGYDRFKGLFK